MSEPTSDPEHLVDIFAVIRNGFTDWLATVAPDRVYWQRQPVQSGQAPAPLPMLIVQVPAAGTVKRYIGGGAIWRGIVQVRVLAADTPAAEETLRAVAAALPAKGTIDDPTAPPNWSIRLQALAPMVIPPSKTMGHVGAQWRVQLERNAA